MQLQTLIRKYKLLLILGLVVIVLVTAIIFAASSLLSSNEQAASSVKQTNQTSRSNSTGNLKGSTSKLSGSTTSTRNLKGLTLRINQIETCNPSLVSAYVAVSSDGGVVHKNFTKKDVKVFLDNAQITNFDFSSVDTAKTPLTSMLVIDRSGSMAGAAIDNAKSAATGYVNNLLPSDQVGVIQFSNTVDVLAAISPNKSTSVNAIARIAASGNTSVYDAISKGVSTVPDCGRKALILLSDGDDTSSTGNQQTATNDANRANLPVFSVGIKGEGFNPAVIKAISESTGGQYLEANTPTEISNLYKNIDGQLTGQFVANLKLTIPKSGAVHTLKITSVVDGSPTTSQRSFVY